MNTMAQIATSTLPAVLAISGSDSSGGAGMQADLKTMLACGVFGMSAITALTAQNTTGVRSIQDTKPDILADQINMVFEDIPPVAVKIGAMEREQDIDGMTDTLIRDQEDMEAAAHRIVERYGCAALVKGGHGTKDANDVLAETDGTVTWFDGARINNPNTHGTGCTLSSAIASYLALGDTLPKAIKHAKKYLTGALKTQLNLGHGSGPMDHFWKYR